MKGQSFCLDWCIAFVDTPQAMFTRDKGPQVASTAITGIRRQQSIFIHCVIVIHSGTRPVCTLSDKLSACGTPET